jgi:hypothetical protein
LLQAVEHRNLYLKKFKKWRFLPKTIVTATNHHLWISTLVQMGRKWLVIKYLCVYYLWEEVCVVKNEISVPLSIYIEQLQRSDSEINHFEKIFLKNASYFTCSDSHNTTIIQRSDFQNVLPIKYSLQMYNLNFSFDINLFSTSINVI